MSRAPESDLGSAMRMILVSSRVETCAGKEGRNLLRIVFLNFSSGTRFAFALDGVNDHPGDVVVAKFRVDQHVVQMRIVPIAPEIHPDEVSTLPIGQSNQILDICNSRQAPPDTGGSFTPRSVNEDVKNVLLVLQHALRSPADNHTIAP